MDESAAASVSVSPAGLLGGFRMQGHLVNTCCFQHRGFSLILGKVSFNLWFRMKRLKEPASYATFLYLPKTNLFVVLELKRVFIY